MHGGGSAPEAVNDQQWRAMFERYYKEHPEAGGYVYLSLRAPNDAWNGFYDDAICPLVERLIRQFVLSRRREPGPGLHPRRLARRLRRLRDRPEDARPVRRHPRLGRGPDARRDARREPPRRAVHRHGRRAGTPPTAAPIAAGRSSKEIQACEGPYGGYPGRFEWVPGVGHSVPDRDKVAEMLKGGARNPYPSRIVWAQSDDVLKHFYWIEAPHPNDSRAHRGLGERQHDHAQGRASRRGRPLARRPARQPRRPRDRHQAQRPGPDHHAPAEPRDLLPRTRGTRRPTVGRTASSRGQSPQTIRQRSESGTSASALTRRLRTVRSKNLDRL